jgi:hypothetical protein
MSKLPDIDTSKVGFIAFWNAIDSGGVSDIDATQVTSDGSIVNYTLYDNGLEGEYSLVNGRTATFRVKEDGWVIAHIDRTEDEGKQTGNADNIRGFWDVIDWTNASNSTSNIVANALEGAVNSLSSQFSNWGSMSYSASDVGLYNYEYSSATTATNFSMTDSPFEHKSTKSGYFSYTANTTLEAVSVSAAANIPDWCEIHTEFEGTYLNDYVTNDYSAKRYGVIDAIAKGLIPNSGTNYGHTMTVDANYTGATGYGRSDALALWS